MKRNLTKLEFEQLCDLFSKTGCGDLLDFIHWIQRTSKKENWSKDKILDIIKHMPPEDKCSSSD